MVDYRIIRSGRRTVAIEIKSGEVVVHELCPRKEMNHSERFYEEVRRVYPDYDKWNGWLKEHGDELMRRMPRVP